MSIAGDSNPASTGAALSLLWNLGSTGGPACVGAIWGGLGYTGAAMSVAFVVAGTFALGGGILILLASRTAAPMTIPRAHEAVGVLAQHLPIVEQIEADDS